MWRKLLRPHLMLIFSMLSFLLGLEPLLAQSSANQTPSIKGQLPNKNQTQSEQKSELKWSLSMGGYRTEDELNQSTSFDLNANLEYQLELNAYTKIQLKPLFSYSSGYSQTQNQKEAASSDWTMKKAEFTVLPGFGFELAAGALNQREIHSSLLWKDQALPALQLRWESATLQGWKLKAFSQGAIATSSSLSTNTTDKEKTPTFESYGAVVSYKGSRLTSETRLSTFAFSHLPQSVATSAATLGNSVTTTNGTDYRFLNEYQGYEVQQKWGLPLTKSLNYQLRGSFVSNRKAEKGMNQAYEIENRLALQVGTQTWTPTYKYFEIQPDATVASYNSSRFQTNRAGYEGGLRFSLEKLFQLSLLAGERDVLIESPSQKRERTLSLELETEHEIF